MYIDFYSKPQRVSSDFNWCTTEILTRYIFDSDELHGTKRCDLIRFSTRNSVEARFFIGNFGTNDFPISTHNGLSGDTFIFENGYIYLWMCCWWCKLICPLDPWNHAKARFFIWRFPGRLKYYSLNRDRKWKSFRLEKYLEEVEISRAESCPTFAGDCIVYCPLNIVTVDKWTTNQSGGFLKN